MTEAMRIGAVRVTGPVGTHEDIVAWCRTAAASVVGVPARFRYRVLNHPASMILLDGGSEAVLAREMEKLNSLLCAFERHGFSGVEIAHASRADAPADPRDLPLLYTVSFTAPDDRAEELHRWYDEEHIPLLLGCPYWMASRRFRVDGAPRPGHTEFLALHWLSDIRALSSPERDAARRTPWRDRLAQEPWFRGTYQVHLREP